MSSSQYHNGVTIEPVEEDEPLGVTLDGPLSWSSHTDKVDVKMGRSMAVLKTCSFCASKMCIFFTQ